MLNEISMGNGKVGRWGWSRDLGVGSRDEGVGIRDWGLGIEIRDWGLGIWD